MALTPEQQAAINAMPDPFGQRDALRRKMEAENAKRQQLTQTQHGQQLRDLSMQGLMGVQGRQAPQAGYTQVGNVAQSQAATIATGPQNQVRDHQLELANRLAGIGNGTVMGAGQMAARQEGNRAIAQQQGMARSMRGSGAALAARSAAMNTGNIAVNVAGQAAQAQRADAMAANQTRAQLLGETRGADIGLAGQQAQLQQQSGLANMDARNQQIFQQAGLNQATSLSNMQARLQMSGMNDQAALQYLAQLYGVDTTELQARLQEEQMRLQAQAQASASRGNMLGNVLQAAGTIGGAYFGGPTGAAIGASAGRAAGGAVG